MFRFSKKRGGTERDVAVSVNASEDSLSPKKCEQAYGMTRGEFLDIAAAAVGGAILAGCGTIPESQENSKRPQYTPTAESIKPETADTGQSEQVKPTESVQGEQKAPPTPQPTPEVQKYQTPEPLIGNEVYIYKGDTSDLPLRFPGTFGQFSFAQIGVNENEAWLGGKDVNKVAESLIGKLANSGMSGSIVMLEVVGDAQDSEVKNVAGLLPIFINERKTESGEKISEAYLIAGVGDSGEMLPVGWGREDGTGYSYFLWKLGQGRKGAPDEGQIGLLVPNLESDVPGAKKIEPLLIPQGKKWKLRSPWDGSEVVLEGSGEAAKKVSASLVSPDWEKFTPEVLVKLSPEMNGFDKGRVVGHDKGRYVTHINKVTGMVEWVFNTEKNEFEHAGESTHTESVNGQEVRVSALVVTSKEYADKFGNNISIGSGKNGILSREFLAASAVEWSHGQMGGRAGYGGGLEDLIDDNNLTEEDKIALVPVLIHGGDFKGTNFEGYLPHALSEGHVGVQGVSFSGVDFVVKVEHDRNANVVDLFNAMDGALSHRNSSDGRMVAVLETPQSLLDVMVMRPKDSNGNIIPYNAYFSYGPVRNAVLRTIEERHLNGEVCDGERLSMVRAIMDYACNGSCADDYANDRYVDDACYAVSSGALNPNGYDVPVLTSDYPAFKGDWFEADCVTNTP